MILLFINIDLGIKNLEEKWPYIIWK